MSVWMVVKYDNYPPYPLAYLRVCATQEVANKLASHLKDAYDTDFSVFECPALTEDADLKSYADLKESIL